MTFKINDNDPITLTSFNMNDDPNMVSYNLYYNQIDLSILPTAFTFMLFEDSGTTVVEEIVTNYTKSVSNNTNLMIRISK